MLSKPPSALQCVEVFDVDAAPLPEHHHQDREPDRRFGRSHRQYEEHEYLTADVARESGKRHEIEIHHEQHQLDAHQQDDDVLAVQKYARDPDREQNAGQRRHLGERHHDRFPEAILTIRTRSLARTATCCAMSCGLTPERRRRVRMMAATLATRRMIAAIWAG